MIWAQRDFWATFLAWWIDGCPAFCPWYQLRQFATTLSRVSLAIGYALLPTMQRIAKALAPIGHA